MCSVSLLRERCNGGFDLMRTNYNTSLPVYTISDYVRQGTHQMNSRSLHLGYLCCVPRSNECIILLGIILRASINQITHVHG